MPYVTKYPSLVNAPVPTKEMLQYLISDLEKAKELIKPFDTDRQYPGGDLFSGSAAKLKLDGGASSNTAVDEFFQYLSLIHILPTWQVNRR